MWNGAISQYSWAVNGHQSKDSMYKLININKLCVDGVD